jgi:hypothetical protein
MTRTFRYLVLLFTIASLARPPLAAVAQPAAQVSPDSLGALSVRETDEVISVYCGERLVLAYCKRPPPLPEAIDPLFQRSGMLHPIQTPAGFTLTAAYPSDHPHQQGIFNAWVSTTYAGHEIDFWNLAKQLGRVRHHEVLALFDSDGQAAGFDVALVHEVLVPTPIDVLRELWRVRVVEATANHFCIELELKQQALTDQPLVVNQYHYGGMAVRGPVAWLLPAKPAGDASSPVVLTNDRGSDRLSGNHQPVKWVRLTGPTEAGGRATIIAMPHASNFRAPEVARLHPDKPYFCFTPCVSAPFTIDRAHEFGGKYRFYTLDEEPSEAWLLEQWTAWHAQ